MLGSVIKDKFILLLIPAVIALIVLAPVVTPIFSMIAFVVCAFALIFLNEDQSITLLISLVPVASVFKVDVDSITYLTLLEMLMVVILIIRNKSFSVSFYGIIIAFGFYLFAMVVCGLDSDIDDIVKLLVRLFLLYQFSRTATIEGINKAIFYFTIVLLAALLLSLNDDYFRLIENYFSDKTLRQDALLGGFKYLRRCSGLFNDPNYCSVAIISSISVLMVQYYHKRCGIEFWIFMAALIPLGMLTYSKSYLLVIIVLLSLFYLFVLIPRHKIMAAVAGIAGVILLMLALAGEFESVNIILGRLNVRGDITSGRNDLLKYYLDFFAQNTMAVLFGRGLSAAPLFGINHVHNFILDAVYKIGVFGLAATTLLIGLSVPKISFKKLHVINLIPTICIFTMYLFLAGIASYDFCYYFYLCIASIKLAESAEGTPLKTFFSWLNCKLKKRKTFLNKLPSLNDSRNVDD